MNSIAQKRSDQGSAEGKSTPGRDQIRPMHVRLRHWQGNGGSVLLNFPAYVLGHERSKLWSVILSPAGGCDWLAAYNKVAFELAMLGRPMTTLVER